MFTPAHSYAQVTLNANGPGQTYELINSVLAPGFTAVEAPDQCSSHPSFGRHIAEVFDSSLNKYVFEFYIHIPSSFPVTATTADNDRCINFDRQRVEIKTYESSPANLKGTIGETITYKWKFKLPLGFKPSPNFTHIHQIKAVGGDEGDPLFTLTVRNATPDVLESIYTKDSSTSQHLQKSINLSSILGIWIDVAEVVNVGTNGTYSIKLKRSSDSTTLLSYSKSNIATIRPSNTFIRPKWGIYRSLLNPTYLRDDSIRLSDISIQEAVLPIKLVNFYANSNDKIIKLNWNVANEINFYGYEIEQSFNGVDFVKLNLVKASNQSLYSFEIRNNDFNKQFFRLKLIDNNGDFSYSNIVSINSNNNNFIAVYPNPAKDFINITIDKIHSNTFLIITDAIGKTLQKIQVTNNITKLSTNNFIHGIYNLQLIENDQIIANKQFTITR